MSLTRRQFLQVGASSCLVGIALPRWLQGVEHFANHSGLDSARTLVLVELQGGNDGLNTLIPVEDDAYYRARPVLSIPKGQTLKLDDDFALHSSLPEIRSLFEAGEGAFLHGVGYPNPNRSHFTSRDIWHSASLDPRPGSTGWVGRAADSAENDNFAIRIGDRELPMALTGKRAQAACLTSLDDLNWCDDPGRKQELERIQAALKSVPRREDPAGHLEFLEELSRESRKQAEDFKSLKRTPATSFPNTDFGQSLALAVDFLASPFAPRVIFVTLGGFDTHAQQADPHAGLLRTVSEGLGAFQKELKRRQLASRVLTCVYSEFGRRVGENASLGTDHGAAAPVMLFGQNVKPGFHGPRPNLTDLDDGDLKYSCDFRSLYATLLSGWLGVEAKSILGKSWPTVDLIRGQAGRSTR